MLKKSATAFKLLVLSAASAVGSVYAQTAPAAADYTQITNQFSAANVIAGIMAIAGVLAAIYAVFRGVKFIFALMKGA